MLSREIVLSRQIDLQRSLKTYIYSSSSTSNLSYQCRYLSARKSKRSIHISELNLLFSIIICLDIFNFIYTSLNYNFILFMFDYNNTKRQKPQSYNALKFRANNKKRKSSLRVYEFLAKLAYSEHPPKWDFIQFTQSLKIKRECTLKKLSLKWT